MQIGILESNEFSSVAIKELQKLGNVNLFDGSNLEAFLEDKEVLFIRLKYFFDKELLNKSPKLKYICTPTTGLNHLDLKEIEKRNIQIVSLKGEEDFLLTIRATPEHTFGLALALLRNYKTAFVEFSSWKRDDFKGFELYGKSIGIIGYGRVGQILSKYFQAFDCRVYFYDIWDKEALYNSTKLDSIDEVIKKSDIIFLCASYSLENEKFFDRQYIDLLKNRYFINTARGELVDEEYLLLKIKENFFKGVALDVIANENSNNKLDKINELTKERNFIVTPHISGATFESMSKTEEFIVEKLKRFLDV